MKYFVSGLQKHQSEYYDTVDKIFGPVCETATLPENVILNVQFMSDKEYKEFTQSSKKCDNGLSLTPEDMKDLRSVEYVQCDNEEEATINDLKSNLVHIIDMPLNLKVLRSDNLGYFFHALANEAAQVKLTDILTPLASEIETLSTTKYSSLLLLTYIEYKLLIQAGLEKDAREYFIEHSDYTLSEIILANDRRIVERAINMTGVLPYYVGMTLALNESTSNKLVDKVLRENSVDAGIRNKLFGDSSVNSDSLSKKVNNRIKIIDELRELLKEPVYELCDNYKCSRDIVMKISTIVEEHFAALM